MGTYKTIRPAENFAGEVSWIGDELGMGQIYHPPKWTIYIDLDPKIEEPWRANIISHY